MKKLNLLDLQSFILKNKFQQVTSREIYENHKFHPDGLWSERIFGRVGSDIRSKTFGYIKLNCKIIHPEVLPILKKISPYINKIINNENKYIIKNGVITQSIDNDYGETGIKFLIDSLDKKLINFNSPAYKKTKKELIEYLNTKYSSFLLDIYPCLPPGGLRDMDESKKSGIIQNSKINDLYQNLLYLSNTMIGDKEIDNNILLKIQNTAISINLFIKSLLKGKEGLLRSRLLSKTIDFSGRLILTSSPDIKLGYVGLPWHTVLVLFEPLCIREFNTNIELKDKIKEFLHVTILNVNDYSKFFGVCEKNPKLIPIELRTEIIGLLNVVTKDKMCLVKRDPVVGTKSWYSAYITILDEGKSCVVSSLDLDPMEGDSDGDTVMVTTVFSKESQEEVKHMNAIHSKLKWNNTKSYDCEMNYPIRLDAAATIFYITKK